VTVHSMAAEQAGARSSWSPGDTTCLTLGWCSVSVYPTPHGPSSRARFRIPTTTPQRLGGVVEVIFADQYTASLKAMLLTDCK
jgi:hypothetical protein